MNMHRRAGQTGRCLSACTVPRRGKRPSPQALNLCRPPGLNSFPTLHPGLPRGTFIGRASGALIRKIGGPVPGSRPPIPRPNRPKHLLLSVICNFCCNGQSSHSGLFALLTTWSVTEQYCSTGKCPVSHQIESQNSRQARENLLAASERDRIYK